MHEKSSSRPSGDAYHAAHGDFTGRQFGKLTVVASAGRKDDQGYRVWICRCECGTTIEASTSALNRNRARDCGFGQRPVMLMKPCARCGKEFRVSTKYFEKRRFCSRACQHEGHHPATKTCAHCGTAYTVSASEAGVSRFCGSSCRAQWTGQQRADAAKLRPLPPHDLTGQRFGRLLVTGLSESRREIGRVFWSCRCDCGQTRELTTSALRQGGHQSCGCLRRDSPRTHGKSGTKEYRAWPAIRRRCGNPRDAAYQLYGGRGITVCERWQESFEAFLDDMGPAPSPKHSIDRIDNDGPYSPENCRWATQTEQMRNIRSNRLIAYDGRTQPLTAWAEECGVSAPTLWARIVTYGWTPERALTTPVPKRDD